MARRYSAESSAQLTNYYLLLQPGPARLHACLWGGVMVEKESETRRELRPVDYDRFGFLRGFERSGPDIKGSLSTKASDLLSPWKPSQDGSSTER